MNILNTESSFSVSPRSLLKKDLSPRCVWTDPGYSNVASRCSATGNYVPAVRKMLSVPIISYGLEIGVGQGCGLWESLHHKDVQTFKRFFTFIKKGSPLLPKQQGILSRIPIRQGFNSPTSLLLYQWRTMPSPIADFPTFVRHRG